MARSSVDRHKIVPRERLPNRRQSVLLDLQHQGSRYGLCVGLKPNGEPGEVFISGARTGSDVDGLLSDVGVLLSRLLQHGDNIEALAAGMGTLGDGTTPASIVGAALNCVAAEMRRTAGDKSSPAKEGG